MQMVAGPWSEPPVSHVDSINGDTAGQAHGPDGDGVQRVGHRVGMDRSQRRRGSGPLRDRILGGRHAATGGRWPTRSRQRLQLTPTTARTTEKRGTTACAPWRHRDTRGNGRTRTTPPRRTPRRVYPPAFQCDGQWADEYHRVVAAAGPPSGRSGDPLRGRVVRPAVPTGTGAWGDVHGCLRHDARGRGPGTRRREMLPRAGGEHADGRGTVVGAPGRAWWRRPKQ